jgi:hypothetical protein
MAGTDIEVDLHHRLRKWVRSSGLPGPDEIERRIGVARTAGTPGPSVSVKTITLALVARRWREMGYSRREVALALSDDPRLGRPRTDGPIEDPVKERAALNCSRERAEKEAAALEQRLKRAERALRDLENKEGTPPPPAVQDHAQRQREAGASRRSLQLQDRHADQLARVKQRKTLAGNRGKWRNCRGLTASRGVQPASRRGSRARHALPFFIHRGWRSPAMTT